MTLYTIYPPELVFQSEEKRTYFTVEFQGRTFVLEMKDGQASIVRLISPDPMDYLNPLWQPGQTVTFSIPNK